MSATSRPIDDRDHFVQARDQMGVRCVGELGPVANTDYQANARPIASHKISGMIADDRDLSNAVDSKVEHRLEE